MPAMARMARPPIEMMSATWVVLSVFRNRPDSTSEAVLERPEVVVAEEKI